MAERKPSVRAFPDGSFPGQPVGSGAHPLACRGLCRSRGAEPGALLGGPAGHVLPPFHRCNSRCGERERSPGEAGAGRARPAGLRRGTPRGEERRRCRSRPRQRRGCHWPRDASLGRAGPGRAAAGGSGGRAAPGGGSGAGRGPGHRSVPLPLMARLFLLLPLP